MNTENLHLLIERYEQGLDETMNDTNREQMKWIATKHFRDIWFSDAVSELGFAAMFREACRECSYVIDNSTVSPTNGVVKAAEHDPVEVARLFNDVLFSDDHGDIAMRQQHMDAFIDGMNALIKQVYPKSWKYPQDRHAASCYLAFFAPDQNFIFRYSEAVRFAEHIEFSSEIGAGSYFSLANYYQLCDSIVEALKEHPSLLEKHAARMDESCYKDDSLHLMAFDLIYCCRTYGYYKGIVYTPSAARKQSASAAAAAAKQALLEKQKQEQISAALAEIDDLDMQLADTEPIDLIGTQVTSLQYGEGIICKQSENKVTVAFGDIEKSFIIHEKFRVRPTFEDDAEIVAAMSKRADLLDKLAKLQSVLKKLKA